MTYALVTIGVVALCTFLTRLFPFVVFGIKGEPPKLIKYIGRVLPPAVIAILLIYCLKSFDITKVTTFVPQLISMSLVVALHCWKRNNLLSIGGGTVCYMILIQMVFA